MAADIGSLDARLSVVEVDYLSASSLSGYATEAWVSSQNYSTDVVDSELSDLLTYLTVDTSLDSVVFSGANVYVQSGAGSTAARVNGVGNLIVGYDEDDSSDKTGSHNLIVGSYNDYSSYGGVVFGEYNSVSGPYSSVTGGYDGTASGDYSSVTGGYEGTASGKHSSVSGGNNGIASGYYSSVTGGYGGSASTYYSSVTGGYSGSASGYYSSVTGGSLGAASTKYSYSP